MRKKCTRDGQFTSFVLFHASVTSGDLPMTFCGASFQEFAFVFSPCQEAEGEANWCMNVSDMLTLFCCILLMGQDCDPDRVLWEKSGVWIGLIDSSGEGGFSGHANRLVMMQAQMRTAFSRSLKGSLVWEF